MFFDVFPPTCVPGTTNNLDIAKGNDCQKIQIFVMGKVF